MTGNPDLRFPFSPFSCSECEELVRVSSKEPSGINREPLKEPVEPACRRCSFEALQMGPEPDVPVSGVRTVQT